MINPRAQFLLSAGIVLYAGGRLTGNAALVVGSITTIYLASIAMLGINSFQVGWIGAETLLIALAYRFGSRLVFRYERKNINPLKPGKDIKRQRVKVHSWIAVSRFAAAAFL